jgi:hypothetical protein
VKSYDSELKKKINIGMGPEEPVSGGAGAVVVLDPHHWLQYYLVTLSENVNFPN